LLSATLNGSSAVTQNDIQSADARLDRSIPGPRFYQMCHAYGIETLIHGDHSGKNSQVDRARLRRDISRAKSVAREVMTDLNAVS